jgi:hypothetical protein
MQLLQRVGHMGQQARQLRWGAQGNLNVATAAAHGAREVHWAPAVAAAQRRTTPGGDERIGFAAGRDQHGAQARRRSGGAL